MKKMFNVKMFSLTLLFLSSIIYTFPTNAADVLCESTSPTNGEPSHSRDLQLYSDEFPWSGVYINGELLSVPNANSVEDLFSIIPDSSSVKTIKFRRKRLEPDNSSILEIIRKMNSPSFNNLEEVDFQCHHIIEGIFSRNSEATKEFVAFLKKSSLQRVLVFGTIFTRPEGEKDINALRDCILNTFARDRLAVYRQVTKKLIDTYEIR